MLCGFCRDFRALRAASGEPRQPRQLGLRPRQVALTTGCDNLRRCDQLAVTHVRYTTHKSKPRSQVRPNYAVFLVAGARFARLSTRMLRISRPKSVLNR